MAPQISLIRRNLIDSLIKQGFENKIIAPAARCSLRAVQRIRSKTEAPDMSSTSNTQIGRRSCITPLMLKALCDKLTEQPDMYRCEMVDFLQEKFDRKVSERSIGRALHSCGWNRKVIRRIAQQRDPDLRDYYLHRMAQYESYHLVFVDESGCDKRAGYRRWGWSLKGTTPVLVTKFSRGKRWHILPAYTQDGIILRRVYQGSTDSALFEDFIAQLLHHCGRYPEPRSVIVMDNASWHLSSKIRSMCDEAGVIVELLSPYSPDFNPIEEYFGVLKRFIKKTWRENQEFINREFKMYLEWCVDVVGDDEVIAQNHFRHAGISITEPPK